MSGCRNYPIARISPHHPVGTISLRTVWSTGATDRRREGAAGGSGRNGEAKYRCGEWYRRCGEEGVDDSGRELGAGVAAQLGKRVGLRHRGLVAAIAGHRRVRVADEHDLGAERDLVAGELVGIAGAVPALVARANQSWRRRRARARSGRCARRSACGGGRTPTRRRRAGRACAGSERGIAILPMSCSSAAIATRSISSSSRPRRRATCHGERRHLVGVPAQLGIGSRSSALRSTPALCKRAEMRPLFFSA